MDVSTIRDTSEEKKEHIDIDRVSTTDTFFVKIRYFDVDTDTFRRSEKNLAKLRVAMNR